MKFWDRYLEALRWTLLGCVGLVAVAFFGTIVYRIVYHYLGDFTGPALAIFAVILLLPAVYVGYGYVVGYYDHLENQKK